MKPVTERTKHELSYTDTMHFTEALLSDPKVAAGTFNISMADANWEGKINLNVFTSEVGRYVSAKVSTSHEQALKNLQQAIIDHEIAYDNAHPKFERPAELQKSLDKIREAYKALVNRD
jgi:hypothetical protein